MIKIVRVTAPKSLASALINGDTTSLSEEDFALLRELEAIGHCVDAVDDVGFLTHPDYGHYAAECLTYVFHVKNA